jgi:hypothetical protein
MSVKAHGRLRVRVAVPRWLWVPLLAAVVGGAVLVWGGHPAASLVLLGPSAVVLGCCVGGSRGADQAERAEEMYAVWTVSNEDPGGQDAGEPPARG